jgi:hypothetical protein
MPAGYFSLVDRLEALHRANATSPNSPRVKTSSPAASPAPTSAGIPPGAGGCGRPLEEHEQ